MGTPGEAWQERKNVGNYRLKLLFGALWVQPHPAKAGPPAGTACCAAAGDRRGEVYTGSKWAAVLSLVRLLLRVATLSLERKPTSSWLYGLAARDPSGSMAGARLHQGLPRNLGGLVTPGDGTCRRVNREATGMRDEESE